MAVIDPSGFFISVRVRVPGANNRVYPLWMGGGALRGGDFFRDDRSYFPDIPIVQSVEIELDLGLNGRISIELGAPYDMGVALLESELFTVGNVLEAQVGYPRIGMFLPWFSAMQVKPSISLNPDSGLTATLEGQGGTFAAARGSSSTQFTNASYASIIDEIGRRPHNNWNISLPRSTGSDDSMYIMRDSVSQGNRSEWMFINYMARQSGCEVLVAPNPDSSGKTLVQFVRRADSLSGTPVATFVCRGQIDMVNYFPILSFESGAEGVWLPRQRVRTNDCNPDTREEQNVSVTQQARERDGRVPRQNEASVGEGSGQVGETTVAALPATGDGQFMTAPVTDTSRTPTEAANMEADEAAFRGGINATITTIGLPNIFPGHMIRLEGLGIFNGNYMITGLTHSANDSEWTTTLKLLTNSSFDGERVSSLIQQRWGDFNDSRPAQQTDTESSGTEAVEPGQDVSNAEQEELAGGAGRS